LKVLKEDEELDQDLTTEGDVCQLSGNETNEERKGREVSFLELHSNGRISGTEWDLPRTPAVQGSSRTSA